MTENAKINSAENEKTADGKNNKSKTKKIKNKGPVRIEAILPVSTIFALIAVYFILFFDSHLRWGLEYGASMANGAEVNIGHLRSSFLNVSLNIENIEVTDASNPGKNMIQIGEIKFGMVVDALLRGKVVIEDASILDIQLQTDRKSPGRVYESAASSDDGYFMKEELETMFSGSAIGEIASFAQSENPELDLTDKVLDLKTSKRLKELNETLDTKKTQWQKRLDEMPEEAKIKALEERADVIGKKKHTTPVEVLASLKEVHSIQKELRGYSDAVKEAKTAIEGDSKLYHSSITDLEKFIQEDVKNLQADFKIPRLDARSLAGSLFGTDFFGYIYQVENYVSMARSYLPPDDGTDEPEKITPPGRSAGVNYVFGKPNSYPSFWLMKAKISSSGAAGLSDLSGEIRNVTTSPATLGKPMTLELRGSMPEKEIKDIRAEIVIDHTTSTPMEKLTLEAGKYPIKNRILTKSSDAELILESATGSLKLSAEIRGDQVNIQANNKFSEARFKSSAKSKILQDIFASALPNMEAVTLNAGAKGTWKDLDVGISSNLASVLESEFKNYLKGKFSDAQKLIEEKVKKQIEEDQKKLLSNFKDTDTYFKKQLSERQNRILNLEKELGKSAAGLESQSSSPIPGNLMNKDSMDSLLKKF